MTDGPETTPVLWSGPAPAPAGPLSASLTFAWRALLKIKHVPEQLGDVIGIPVMFTLLFTYLFGGALEGSTGGYLQFLLPGTLALAVVFVTVYSGVTLNRDLSTGAFDRFRSLPVWRPAPIVGAMIGDLGRYLLAAAIVLGLGFAMGYRSAGGPGGVLAAVALVIAFALSLSCVWTTLGLVLRTPNAVLNFGFVILFPLTFVSNVFVEPGTMPGWLRSAADANPVTHLTTAVRELMGGAPAVHDVAWVLLASLAIAALFAPLTGWLYRRR
ncbi:MAG: ABC transporter permease [Nocardioides sp.]|nr:ABC transporter permease [Nocardioides sp.]